MADGETVLTADAESAVSEDVAEATADATQDKAEATDDTGAASETTSDKEPGADEGADKGDEPEGAPEQYEAFTVPEGMELDKAAVEAFHPLAKDLGLNQEQAQKLVDMYAAQQAKQAEAWAETRQQWLSDLKADPEFAGEKFNANSKVAVAAIQKFGSPELVSLLNNTGMGNHPELVKFALNVGRHLAEDTHVPAGETTGDDPESRALRLYPSMKK